MSQEMIAYYLCSFLSFVPAIVLHEVSHGFVAYKLGDPTAKRAGRLTLNPLAHVDTFGTILLPFIMMVAGGPVFGYAKPVPYNPTYFKNKRTGDFLVGMAGPAANLVMALAAAIVSWLLYPYALQSVGAGGFFSYFYTVFLPMFALINLFLMFFNLLPVPPLDGSSIFALFIPERSLPSYYKVERYAMPVLLVLLFVVPYLFNVDPISAYLRFTAGGVANLIFPYPIY